MLLSERPSLDSETYRKVEWLLYDYKTLDSAIESLEAELEEILPPLSASVVTVGGGRAKSPLDTSRTERWGIMRAESPRAVKIGRLLKRKRREQKALRAVRKILTPEQLTLVRLKYDEEKSNREAIKAMGLKNRTYYRLKKAVIEKVARYLHF